MSEIETSVYSSTVNEPKYYTERKREERRKVKNILRKVAGIPFALLYGIFLYFVLRYMILSEPREHLMSNSTNLSASFINTTTTTTKKNKFDGSNWSKAQTVYFAGKHFPELLYMSSAFTAVVGITSIFSCRARCSMLLILPCVITGRSRALLFTFIMGLLVDGPIESLVHNFDEMSENTACVYEAIAQMARTSILKLNHVFTLFAKLKKAAEFPFVSLIRLPPTTQTTHTNLTFPQIVAIKKQIDLMKDGMNQVRKYTKILRKTLTIISIVLMVFDAIKYLRSYYSDNSFDNMYVNRNVRHFWKRKGYEKLTPLRHWEENEGYKSSSSVKFTRLEIEKSFRRLIPTIIFSLLVSTVMISDYLVAEMLQSIKDEEEIKIEGLEDDVARVVQIILKKFYQRTKSCELHPLKTSVNQYVLICMFLLVAGVSCVCEVLLSRTRARMCNIFYNDRAQERADYLHYRITAGRINRRVQMLLIVRRELERRERLEKFSPWSKLRKLCCKQTSILICPGCGRKVKPKNTKAISLNFGETRTDGRICDDCHLDFKMVNNQPFSYDVNHLTNDVSPAFHM